MWVFAYEKTSPLDCVDAGDAGVGPGHIHLRRKGRGLIDLHVSVNRSPALDLRRVLSGFRAVMEKEGHPVSWREFDLNLNDKVEFPGFKEDIQPLRAEGAFDPAPAWADLASRLQAAWGPK